MDQYNESYLLYEDDIISEEEKQEIIRTVDISFNTGFDNNENKLNIPAEKNGLVIPVIIGLSVIICTFFLSFSLLTEFIIDDTEVYKFNSAAITESEWEILKTYKKETEFAIKTKDVEITSYKAKIADYDRRLKEIRDLVRIKREIEVQLDSEKIRLADEGIGNNEITEQIEALEKQKLSSLSPVLSAYSNLSVAELNSQIDNILNEKSNSEQLLKNATAERDKIVMEGSRIEEDLESIEIDLADNGEILFELNELESDKGNQDFFNDWIDEMYVNIFTKAEKADYSGALSDIETLMMTLNDNSNPLVAGLGEKKLAFQTKNLEYVRAFAQSAMDDSISMDDFVRDIESINLRFQNSLNDIERKKVETELRSLIFSIPELSEAYSLLIKSESASEGKIPAKAAAAGGINTGPVYFGRIARIHFNNIFIIPAAENSITAGDKFYVYKLDADGKETEIGSGTIIEVSGDNINGRIVSLSNTRSKPEKDDLIYIDS